MKDTVMLPVEPGAPGPLRHRAETKFRPVIRFTFFGLLLLVTAPAGSQAPEHFFVGRTEGVGVVSVILSGRHGVRDRSRGRIEQGGILVLDQIVEEEGRPARRSSWRLARSRDNRITGTISDARSPVSGEVAGNVIRLRYRCAEGPSVEQSITLHPGGRTATNRMTFRRFGLTVATLESTIRRVD
jgi:hypothetical protein